MDHRDVPRQLGQDVHVAQIDHDWVVLDLRTQRYLLLPSAAPAERVDAAAIVARLTEAGLPTLGPEEGLASAVSPLPTSDIEADPIGAITWGDLRDALIASCDVWCVYRGRSLSQLLELAQTGSTETPRVAGDEAAIALARRFKRWSVLAPVPSKCLIRSFMLLRYLQRHRVSATWVIAVRTWPFRAHCWIQTGTTVLDDAHERLVAYRPLLEVQG